jgi:AcrR family transcriptional regulator
MKASSFPKATESTQQRRDHIVQAATTVIARDGLPALSVRAVAKCAGCSRGLVEHYFRNKAALLIAANDWKNKAYLQRVEAAAGAKSGLEALELRLRNLVPYNETIQNEWKVRMAFWHQGISINTIKETNNQSFYAVYNALLEDMRQAQAAGEIASTIPLVETSELLLMMVIGLCVFAMNDAKLRKKAPLDRRLEMILGFLKTADVASLVVGDPAKDY